MIKMHKITKKSKGKAMMTKPLKNIVQSDESTVVFEYEPNKERETSYQSEAELENELITLLQNQGYEHIKLSNHQELKENLRIQLQKLNNFRFSDAEWERFYQSILANQGEGVSEKAQKIQKDYIQTILLDNGFNKNIKLIDKTNIHNNILQVINQYGIEGKYKNRYDVSILVNGLPLVHIELKKRGVAIKEAFNQIKRYGRESFWAEGGIFEYIQIFVISNGTQSKYYSNTTRKVHIGGEQSKNTFEFTSHWADSKNKPILDLMDFGKTFFARHTLLNILTRYCVFTSQGKLLVMRPYQIVATERIIEQIHLLHHQRAKAKSLSCNGGYIWHTTGSGKTLTSFKTATLATQFPFISKVLFIVDRKDLDYQTMKEYNNFEEDSVKSNTNTEILKKQLGDPSIKIIVTMIQKLDKFIKNNPDHPIFDSEVVLIFDECHRSQLGSMHKAITKAFKNYYLFGFTGTPIFAENCNPNTPQGTTEAKFGKVLHQYTIVDAIADKNVLRFKVSYHDTIKSKEGIEGKSLKAIDTEKALLDPRRIEKVTGYILKNFAHLTKRDESYIFDGLENIQSVAKNRIKIKEKRKSLMLEGFNSILACASIEACKLYYKAFKNVRHNLKIAMIFSYGANEDLDGLDDENNESTERLDQDSRDFLENVIKDYNAMFGTNYDTSDQKFQNYYKDISLRMKHREIDILIVVNMFLTGFDATTLNTLWVDKNLRYHGLIQAFSRTNRILNSIKTFGNIVCFRDLEKNLNDALKLFGNKDAKGIILLRSYRDYYDGYTQDNKKYEGYRSLIKKLLKDFPLGEKITSEAKKKEFIRLYGQILKIRNILECFDEFKDDSLISMRDLQDYQGMYLDLYEELRGKDGGEKEEINDDLIFEIELIKRVEVNIDYILNLIEQYTKTQDKQEQNLIKESIASGISSSPEMRNKKDLIMKFVERINARSKDIREDFSEYIEQQREKEFQQLISFYKLKEEEAYKFVRRAFEDGKISFEGTEFPKLLPKENSSYFAKDSNRKEVKVKISRALLEFFERFYTISSPVFNENEDKEKCEDAG